MQSVFHVLNLFQALTHVSEACSPLLDGCRKNRQKWQALAEQQENLINGESNQSKRNWDADGTPTNSSSRRRHSNRGVLHFAKHCMNLASVLPLLYYFFPRFKIEHDHVDAKMIWRPSVSFITSDWDGKRPAGVVFAAPPHKKVLVQALTVPESLLLYRCT